MSNYIHKFFFFTILYLFIFSLYIEEIKVRFCLPSSMVALHRVVVSSETGATDWSSISLSQSSTKERWGKWVAKSFNSCEKRAEK